MQRLAGVVQFCTQKNIRTREGTCVCCSIVFEAMFVLVGLQKPKTEQSSQYPGPKVSEARDVKVRGWERCGGAEVRR